MSPLTNGLTPHEVQRQKRRGWNYLFIAPVEPQLLTELFHSPPGPVEECRAQHAGLGSGSPCFSCFVLNRSSVSTAAGALLRGAVERCLTHKLGCTGPIKQVRGKRRQSSPSLKGSPAPHSSAIHIDSGICGGLALRAHQMEAELGPM